MLFLLSDVIHQQNTQHDYDADVQGRYLPLPAVIILPKP